MGNIFCIHDNENCLNVEKKDEESIIVTERDLLSTSYQEREKLEKLDKNP